MSFLKELASTVTRTLQDPFVQGMIGLYFLARSAEGIHQTMMEMQEASREAFNAAAEQLAQAAAYSQPFQPPGEKPKTIPQEEDKDLNAYHGIGSGSIPE